MFKIITAYTKEMHQISKTSVPTFKKYCKKQNYQFTAYKLNKINKPPSWYKIKLLLDLFNNNVNYVLWIDCDVIVVNYNFDLHKILSNNNYIYLSEDIRGINCGVMLWINNSSTKDILNNLWSMNKKYTYVQWEQTAFVDLVESNYNNIQNMIKIIPQNIFNAYDYNLYNLSYNKGQVNQESFLFHLPGMPNKNRFEILKKRKITI